MHISIVGQSLFLVNIVPVFPSLRGPVAPRGPSGPRGPLGAPGPAVPPRVAPPPTSAPDGGNSLVGGGGDGEGARTFFPESWIWAIQKTE